LIFEESPPSAGFFSPVEKNARLTQHQWDAGMSFTCNPGAANLGSSTLLTLLNTGEHAGVGQLIACSVFATWKVDAWR